MTSGGPDRSERCSFLPHSCWWLLFISGTHIAIALGLTASFILLVVEQVPIATLGQVAFKSLDSYSLAAVPLFVLAGDLLTRGQIAQVIVDLIGSVVRAFRAGLALTAMLSCVFFAAISGSSVASAAAIGGATVETLKAENYPASFAAGIVAVGGTLGLMIPPSLSFILIGHDGGPADRQAVHRRRDAGHLRRHRAVSRDHLHLAQARLRRHAAACRLGPLQGQVPAGHRRAVPAGADHRHDLRRHLHAHRGIGRGRGVCSDFVAVGLSPR